MKSHGEIKWVGGRRIATPEYRAWQAMKNRCLNPKANDWHYYGGRGITVHERWLTYDNFLLDVGRRPSDLHTLDRKDVNKGYSKKNCRWATRRQQSQNRTDTRFTHDQIRQIRQLYASGRWYQKELATKFNTTQAAISQIVRNAAWLID